MKSQPHIAAIKELERGYQFFVKHFKVTELEKINVVFTLIPNGSKRRFNGWFAESKWKEKVDEEKIDSNPPEKYHEINICADTLNRNPEDIFETLLHEMAHLLNSVRGVNDCNPKNQYHNKKFKSVAEENFHLIVEKFPGRGYAKTSLSETSRKAIEQLNPNKEAFGYFRVFTPRLSLESPYIMISLKRKDWEDRLDALKEKLEMEEDSSYNAVVKRIIELYEFGQ